MKKPTFSAVAELCLADAETRVRLGEKTPWLTRNYKQRLDCYCLPYLGDMPIADITSATMREFRDHLAEKGLKLSSILPILSTASVVLKMADDDGLLKKMPRIPRKGQKPSPRPAFTRPEYHKLLTFLRKLERANPPMVVRGHPITKELRYAVTFMVNSFLRPGDLIVMQRKHVEKVDGEDGRFLRLRLPSSKGHTAPVITMPVAVPIYDRLVKFHGRAYGEQDDYVFFPALKRPFARELLRRQFTAVLEAADLRTTAAGEQHTLYSLRHTAIVFRLVNSKNLDILTLARACRTSVDMIDRYYASSLTAEMNVDKLHSFKRQTRYVETKPGVVREVGDG